MSAKIGFVILGIAILIISGCVQSPEIKVPVSTNISGTNITIATPVPTIEITTPKVTPTIPKELPPNTIFVSARMLKPVDWGNGKLELVSMKVQIYNQRNTPLSIKAQIINDNTILEEKSFSLAGEGSNIEFANEKSHFINNTNITLRLLVQDYKPIDYDVVEAGGLS
ncbi:MAG: hypothetical protein O8C64_02510 [Candidatus Methanoperedens sp.]|nr:hypothetical protein [Candidatus Methanoperedens sp.]MCZ7405985.1 hypothetical protein [Candidatus Methanoperedens sp.]